MIFSSSRPLCFNHRIETHISAWQSVLNLLTSALYSAPVSPTEIIERSIGSLSIKTTTKQMRIIIEFTSRSYLYLLL